MGHKSNPIGLRLQINRTWDSRWFADGADYGRLLMEDIKIRQYIMKNLPQAAISKVVIERPGQAVPRVDLCRPSGCHHRQEGRGHRKAAPQAREFTSSDVSLNIVEIRSRKSIPSSLRRVLPTSSNAVSLSVAP